MEQFDIKVEPETHNDDTPHVHNMQQIDTFLTCNRKIKYGTMLHDELIIKDDPDSDNKCSELIDDTQVMCTSTPQSSDGVVMHFAEPAADMGYDVPAPLLVTHLMDAMSKQDLKHSPMQNKLSTMEQLDIKVEPETHNDDTPHVHNMQQTDTFLTCNKKIKYESMLHDELIIKDDPDSDSKYSELIDDTQVMCASSDGVAIHTTEEPAVDAGYDEPAPLLVTQLMDAQTSSGLNILPVPLKVEVEDSVDRLEVSSLEDVDKQQVVPSGLRTDDVCVSGNSDCTRTVSVKEHAKCTASGNTYQCDVCHKCFSYKSSLKCHIFIHTGDKPYKCNTCNKTFTRSSSFHRHSRIHTSEKPYKCNMCDKSYIQLGKLREHTRRHTGEKPYKCNMCNKSFSRSCNLHDHIRTHTGEKPYKCNICTKSFSQSSHLHYHIRTHTGEKPHKCNMCDKRFSQSSNLQYHIRTHTGQKPYKCNLRDKSYSHLSHLHRHTVRYTGEKPYKCNMCDKSFTRSSNLHRHTRSHTGEKPYKCEMCDKSFTRSSNLHRHMRNHTGEKPYKCKLCDTKFRNLSNLQRQTDIHTGENPYKCNMCDKNFSLSSNLNNHIRTY